MGDTGVNNGQKSRLLTGLYWLTVAFLVVLIGLLSAQVWAQRPTKEPTVYLTVAFADLRGRGPGASL